MDDMFTLTGVTKTINISSAEFAGGFRVRKNDDINGKNENNTTAKTARDARFGGPRGMRPNGEPQKQQQQQQ